MDFFCCYFIDIFRKISQCISPVLLNTALLFLLLVRKELLSFISYIFIEHHRGQTLWDSCNSETNRYDALISSLWVLEFHNVKVTKTKKKAGGSNMHEAIFLCNISTTDIKGEEICAYNLSIYFVAKILFDL